MDPETAQEHIDAAVAEAERAAEIALADLRATHEDEIARLREQLAAAEIAAYERGRADTNAELAPLRLIADALLDRVIEPIAERGPDLFKSVASIDLYVSPAKADAVIATLRHMADVTGMHLDRPELEPMRPLMDALHLELSRRGGDCIEYLPEVPGHSPAMLRLGRCVLSGMSAGALLEALRDAALDFTQDCED